MTNPGGAGIRLELWPEPFAIVRLRTAPADLAAVQSGNAPVALVLAPGDITLMAPHSVVDALPAGLVEAGSREWRALTLDAEFPLDTVGVFAAVTRVLADVDVPVMGFSSHRTDHFLVPSALLGRALAALHNARLERFLTG